ncbi:MAG: NAD(+) synthase [Bacillota bacterium]
MDCARVADYLADWIRDQVSSAGARGVVVAISGGVDSAVVAALSARAMPGSILGLLLPAHNDPQDMEDARAVAQAFGIPTEVIDLAPLFDLAVESFERRATREDAKDATPHHPGRPSVAVANLKPRLRMITLYYFANKLNYLVAGTGNRSEIEVGYFTKYGDGGVDILPIGGLVKTQVWELARFLGVPERVVSKTPTAGLWQGQTDEGEMGLTYRDLDRFLLTGQASPEVRERIARMHARSEHKRRCAPVAELPPELLA